MLVNTKSTGIFGVLECRILQTLPTHSILYENQVFQKKLDMYSQFRQVPAVSIF